MIRYQDENFLTLENALSYIEGLNLDQDFYENEATKRLQSLKLHASK
jgi:hypothetical protein